MGRRGDHTLDEIKTMAVDAAERIVRKKGREGLSTRKIAKEIGYTSGSLYLVFKNFEDLLMHVNGRTLERLKAELTRESSRQTDPLAAVRAICWAYIRFAERNQEFWSLVYEYPWESKGTRPAWYQSLIDHCFQALASRLGELAQGKSADEILKGSQSLWAIIHGTHHLFLSGRAQAAGLKATDDLMDFQIDLFLRGYLGLEKVRP